MIQAVCDRCGVVSAFRESDAGAVRECPVCGEKMIVPAGHILIRPPKPGDAVSAEQRDLLLRLGAKPEMLTALTKKQAARLVDRLMALQDAGGLQRAFLSEDSALVRFIGKTARPFAWSVVIVSCVVLAIGVFLMLKPDAKGNNAPVKVSREPAQQRQASKSKKFIQLPPDPPVESTPPPAPSPTPPPLDPVEKLFQGMTLDEAREVLGSPGELIFSGTSPKGRTSKYEWSVPKGILRVELLDDAVEGWKIANREKTSNTAAHRASMYDIPIELIAVSLNRDPAMLRASGSLRNVSLAPLSGIHVVCSFLDAAGQLVRTERGSTVPETIAPNQTASFSIGVFPNTAIDSVQVSFENSGGASIGFRNDTGDTRRRL